MSNQRYSPEFKDEAVRQVIERGHHVVDVAKNLGISQHSLYKWVKACKPDSSAQKENELLDAKKEILRLRSQLKRTEEERDILKRPQGTLQVNPSKVPIYKRQPNSV